MRFLDEHRRRPASLADHLPWAALVSPGVVLNKDGSFTTAFSFRGPDLESSTEEELMAVRARLNNALKRLGTGWCLHVEAQRRPAAAYPESEFEAEAAWLVDAERRDRFEAAEPAFETDYRLALTWLPRADETRRLERWLFDGLARAGQDWRQTLASFRREADATFDLLADALPEIAPLEDAVLLTWLHACVSPNPHPVRPLETPVFLDVWLADAGLTGGTAPRLGDQWLRTVSVRGLPSATRPGLLDGLGTLPVSYRWSARWIGLDKAEAEREIVKLRKRWFSKRKGVGALLREAITREEQPLIDTDAASKTEECDGALGAGALVTGGLAVGGAGLLAGAGLVATGGAAARLAGPARAASGAGAGRSTPPSGSGSPSSPSSPPPSPGSPRPGGVPHASNDNPSSSGPRSAPGGSGVGEARRAWAPDADPKAETPSVGAPRSASAGKDAADGVPGSADRAGSARKPEVIAREAEAARRDFHRAAAGGDAPAMARSQDRSAALQAFFVANAGRGLMPSGETSGVLSPSLKTEEP